MQWASTLKERERARRSAPAFSLRLLYTPGEGVVEAGPVPLRAGETVLGRAADSVDIALTSDPRVSRRHAIVRIDPSSERVTLADSSSTETCVDGRSIDEVALTNGALLRLGDSFLLFRRELSHVDPDGEEADDFGLLGQASVMHRVRRTLALAGGAQTTVLLLGETGTGKELAARAVHQASGRAGPFVAVNCSAIVESLAEAQLFGHIAGSYSGAKTDAPGFFQAASGGTLFLDEVGELGAGVQPKLLRALEERVVLPVGATKPVACDVRLVAATNRDLVKEVGAQRFRGDLYARLAQFVIEMPPLRDRREDVLALFVHALGAPLPELDPELVQALLLHSWPFNVRELCKVAGGWRALWPNATRVELDAVGRHFDGVTRGDEVTGDDSRPDHGPETKPEWRPDDKREEAGHEAAPIPDRARLEALLREHRGIVANVARAAGRSRKQVYRWLDSHGLKADDYRQG